MTKKANKMLAVYTEKFEVHVQYFAMNVEMFKKEEKLDEKYDFTKSLINDIKEDFVNMISGMYRFDMLSVKDFEELYEEAHKMHKEIINKVIDVYIEAKY